MESKPRVLEDNFFRNIDNAVLLAHITNHPRYSEEGKALLLHHFCPKYNHSNDVINWISPRAHKYTQTNTRSPFIPACHNIPNKGVFFHGILGFFKGVFSVVKKKTHTF